ncbi:hypothetical protein [uncultured Halopseudomonas sp.]|uniref:hypothetical protein n=1 Tax=uncultured Halopseudomonas sp. TaxID=2901193 RepID=UPI0030EB9A36|tara:strand:- start:67404 stop:68027 length:624 start_codon:yes stop_codon:yes gene_type:complete
MTETLEKALLDVRSAYRLLADYQQRMFELLGFVREQLHATHYHHEYVYSLPQGLGGLENQCHSGKRYLPFYDLSAIWLKKKGQDAPWDDHRPGDLMFGAWVRSDTGFDKFTGEFSDKPVEQTRSELMLSVVVCDTPAPKPCNWYGNVWPAIDYPEDGEVNDHDLPGYRCFAKAIDLAQLGDKIAIDKAINDWRAVALMKLGLPSGAF